MSNMVQAIRMALHVAEERHDLTDVFGEDVGPPLGGAFTATQGIKCAWNSPLDERGIVGASIVLGLAGSRNVAEIQFCDYAYNTIDLLKLAGMQSWSSNGDWNCPMTVMTPVGSGIRGSIYHSHSFDTAATHIPGFKIAMPTTARDEQDDRRAAGRPEQMAAAVARHTGHLHSLWRRPDRAPRARRHGGQLRT